MKKFKEGDRVRVYGADKRNYALFDGEKGEVVLIEPNEVRVLVDGDDCAVPFHPKQCRRLIKKKRREFWIGLPKSQGCHPSVFTSDSHVSPHPMFETADYSEIIHVVEVRK